MPDHGTDEYWKNKTGMSIQPESSLAGKEITITLDCYCTYDDGEILRVTPKGGDPMLSLEFSKHLYEVQQETLPEECTANYPPEGFIPK